MMTLILALAIGAADTPIAALDKLAGTWQATALEVDGKAPESIEASLTIRGEKFTASAKGRDETGKVVLDSAKGWLDLRNKDGAVLLAALYKVEGDQLTICWRADDKRPEKIAGGKGITIVSYKRKAKAKS